MPIFGRMIDYTMIQPHSEILCSSEQEVSDFSEHTGSYFQDSAHLVVTGWKTVEGRETEQRWGGANGSLGTQRRIHPRGNFF